MQTAISRVCLFLVLTPLLFLFSGRGVQAQLTLTAPSVAAGYRLTTFATGFPTDSIESGIDGPNGIAFTLSGSVMISDHPGNVRVFPTNVDGQSAANVPAAYNYGYGDALGLAQVGTAFFLADQQGNSVLQLNSDGTLNRTIVSNIPNATGIIANPNNGHLLVSNYGSNPAVWDVDPVAKTDTVLLNLPGDADGMATDGTILYVKSGDYGSEHILGFRLKDKSQVFDSGVIDGADGVAIGAGTLAGTLFVNTNFGQVYQINLTTHLITLIASGGTRGDFVTAAPDGTLFVTQSDSVLRLTAPNGGGFGISSAWTATSLSVGSGNVTHLLWDKSDGSAVVWMLNSSGIQTGSSPVFGPFDCWTAKKVASLPGGGSALLWTNTDGSATVYLLNASGGKAGQSPVFGPYAGWTAQSLSAGSDGTMRLLWDNSDGRMVVWTLNASGSQTGYSPTYGPYDGWSAKTISTGADGGTRVLWDKSDGSAVVWTLDLAGNESAYSSVYGPYTGWTASDIGTGSDNNTRVLWTSTGGQAVEWTINGAGVETAYSSVFGPYSGWSARGLSAGPDGGVRLLWDSVSGSSQVWHLDAGGNHTDGSPVFGPY